MPLALLPAVPADAPRLIDITFSAFANDILMTTCYPDTPANRSWWTSSLETQMTHPKQILVFKIIDTGSNDRIIAWAKWLVYRKSDKSGMMVGGAVNPNVDPSPDMDIEACRSLAGGQYKLWGETVGERDHYWLNMICTEPEYQRRGAASMLIAHGTQLADDEGLECFSACTTQANQNMATIFAKAGFESGASEPVVHGKGMSIHAGHRLARNTSPASAIVEATP